MFIVIPIYANDKMIYNTFEIVISYYNSTLP